MEDSWQPEGWETWSQEQRTIWRRDRQLDGMVRMLNDLKEQVAQRDRLIEELRSELEELRDQLG